MGRRARGTDQNHWSGALALPGHAFIAGTIGGLR
jgi:hypothetical protein